MDRSIPYKWLVMIPVSMGIFISTLDSSIVNISLPAMTANLNSYRSVVDWVVMAYLLTITCMLLTMGRIADLYGLKKIYALGFSIFTIGSVFCGFSMSAEQLIASRILQGVGASMLMAIGLAIITNVFPPNERGKALGIGGSIVSIGIMTGPVLGGLILQAAGWRWIFFINIPVGVIGTIAVLRILKKDNIFKKQKLDIIGAATLFIALAALLLAMNQGENLGWDSWQIILLFVIFIVTLLVFVFIELRTESPIIQLDLFKNRLFSASIVSAIISFMVLFTITIRMPFYLHDILNYEPYQMGLILTAMPIAMSLVAPISGWASDKIGSRLLTTTGLSIVATALLLVSMLTATSSWLDIYLRLVVLGIGLGIFTSPNTSAIMGSVSRERLGMGSGVVATMRNTGMALGIALSGAVLAMICGSQGSVTICVSGMHVLYQVSAIICFFGVVVSFLRGGKLLPKR